MSIRRIEVVPYNPDWPEQFLREASLIRAILSNVDVQVHHIGSTSVPKLAAKTIIDMLLEVPDLTALDDVQAEFEQLGYTAMGEYGISGRRYFQKGGVQHSHHLHAFTEGDSNITRHLAFRDYLRVNASARAEYQAIKEEGARLSPTNASAYMAHKHAFIQHHETIAMERFRRSCTNECHWYD